MPDPTVDSAGVPWRGRSVPDPGFSGDQGRSDPALDEALAEYDAAAPPAAAPSGAAGSPHASTAASGAAGTPPSASPYDAARHLAAHRRVLAALAHARLLVPVVAVLDETGEGHHGLAAEKSTDMALVTLEAPDGQPAVPVFTALDRLAAWRADARPVPAEAQRVALSAVADGATRLVVDPAGPVTYVVDRAPLWALAQGQDWVAPHESQAVREAVRAALADLAEVRAAFVATRPPSTLRLTLALAPGLAADRLQAMTELVSRRLAEQEASVLLDGVALAFVPDGSAPADAGEAVLRRE